MPSSPGAPARLAEIRARRADGGEVELWWQEEAGTGQNNKITRHWAKRSSRPVAAKDPKKTISSSLFGAVCPGKGQAVALVMPCVTTEAMNAHLAEISRTVQVGAHAVLLLDQTGTSSCLQVPATITLLPLPPRSPEFNLVENLWQFLRNNRLSNRIFGSQEDILHHCCQAWNKLVSQPERIASLATPVMGS